MTQIIDHGKWVLYQPDRLPEYAPLTALFARRESDGVDWYDYVRNGKNFFADTVKFTVLCQNLTVGAATRDATRLFPAGALVRELTEFHGRDPQAELEKIKRYDPDSNTLHDWKPMALPVSDLEARVMAIEAKLGLGG